MRIEFANAERSGIDWTRQVFRIGSAADNDLVLEGAGIAPHHLQLLRDARGLSLTVTPGAGRVYLNARQVRERALVRAGDSLGIGDTRLRLCDVAQGEAPRIGLAGLRAVAGPLSGRARQIGEHLDLDNTGLWPLGLAHAPDACVSLRREDDALHLRCVHLPESCLLTLNGVPVREAVLRDGDQIAIGPHRFIVDASERVVDTPASTPGNDAMLPEDSAGPRREVWWLIVTAAALALAIAAFLFLRL
ncbi:FHA domain-containing protein [Oleiagrimonas soli]|uniref:PSer/pThr/pTyr-binding forkhead associated (FHA) protein n=1 Tax=Oleiagrimonas soli TaxID=1543381 RepID=A0A099CXJ4_9GAMM|nr:FHA domain-containing protein [Oleiagrimonas soli]KGI78454.1 hypothetical protein LF63_0108545 [Oleiagrimonas soli]MBB6183159.1 pSer/pThr/pTyr-binding forkhead associated (FHA) protein [Oleiagrimonas soli]